MGHAHSDATKKVYGRPRRPDQIELVACMRAYIRQGMTTGAAAAALVELHSPIIGSETDRDRRTRLKKEARSVERRYREFSKSLLRPWSSVPVELAVPMPGLRFGPRLLNGRPLPECTAFAMQTPPRRGRPKKIQRS